ncbi:MAG: hypothetical protein Q8N65_02915 [bacterium]|nr:hypothetical protein [bacterium]
MIKNPHPGRFIVIDGLDGSGKSTQLKLLIRRLKRGGHRVAFFDFPQHGERSATLVDDYLNGKYGTAEEVGPYRASIFFACDRYDASFKIRKQLQAGKIVISDRYVTSAIGYQGGKIKDQKQRQKYLKWLYDLEYGIFEIPKPDISLIFDVSPEISFRLSDSRTITDKKKLAKRQSYLENKPKDIYEKDLNHLKNAFRSYMKAAKDNPKDFKLVGCLENGKLLPPKIIHEKIWQEIKKIL